MKKSSSVWLTSVAVAVQLGILTPVLAEDFTSALTQGKAHADMRLRYETVEQDNTLQDASALTLRTRLGYKTGSYHGFSGLVEMEDVRIVGGVDEYSVGPTGFQPGLYSVIADPEITEVDQGFIQYQNELVTAKFGRQVITLDNHRFVGHVGWRQDRQTFDAVRFSATPIKDLSIDYAYVFKRNRIFAEAADMRAKDNLLNISYPTSIGSVTGYAYLLEDDIDTDNAVDTYGLRLAGSVPKGDLKLMYTVEYATQEAETGASQFDADYLFVEGGLAVVGITTQLGYESLGSDSGAYGFATPLATLHKFNGWADQFLATPNQGLVDVYVSFSGQALGGKWSVVYHDFEADESGAGVDDLGSEVDLMFAKKFGKTYSAGIKHAAYSAGDVDAGKVDTDKLWIWAGITF